MDWWTIQQAESQNDIYNREAWQCFVELPKWDLIKLNINSSSLTAGRRGKQLWDIYANS